MDQLLKQISFLQDAVLQDALLALGLIAAIALVAGARRDLRRETRQRERALKAIEAKVAALPREAKKAPVPASVPDQRGTANVVANSLPALRSGVNLNWRVQALRLLRRGQDVAHISTVLGVSRREVELLIRVHQLASGRSVSRTI